MLLDLGVLKVLLQVGLMLGWSVGGKGAAGVKFTVWSWAGKELNILSCRFV